MLRRGSLMLRCSLMLRWITLKWSWLLLTHVHLLWKCRHHTRHVEGPLLTGGGGGLVHGHAGISLYLSSPSLIRWWVVRLAIRLSSILAWSHHARLPGKMRRNTRLSSHRWLHARLDSDWWQARLDRARWWHA